MQRVISNWCLLIILNVHEGEKIFHTLINSSLLTVPKRRRSIFATNFKVDKIARVWREKNLIDLKSLNYWCLFPRWAKGMQIFMQILSFWWGNWLKLRMENLIISFSNYGLLKWHSLWLVYEILIYCLHLTVSLF